MPTRDDSGFEVLLKPLQDILSKAWEIALTKCLEEYLLYIDIKNDPRGARFINFTEAAMLVQNSATFYCKRVDSVHLGCRQFVEKLHKTFIAVYGVEILKERNTEKGEECDENGVPTRKKRVTKNLQNDNFDLLDMVCSESNINIKPESIQKHTEKRNLVLNKYIKTQVKGNTSIPVYQTKGADMGIKEEFRLNWRISSSGLLNEDFISNSETKLCWGCVSNDISINENMEDQLMDADCSMEIDNGPSDIDCLDVPNDSFQGQVTSPMAPSPIPPEDPEPLPPPRVPAVPKKQNNFKDLKFDFFIPLKLAQKKQTFVLPEHLIKEVKDWKSYRKRKRDDEENKENDRRELLRVKEFFKFLRHYEIQDSSNPDFKKILSTKARRQELLQRRRDNAKKVERAAAEYHDDFPGFEDDRSDNENFEDDDQFELGGNEADVGVVDVGSILHLPVNSQSQDESKSTYEQDAVRTMQQYQENKRKNANELTEVAKRVSAWHESLHPVLEMAEVRSKFDIHSYGSQILEMFPKEVKHPVLPFNILVNGQPREEVSRYLLSTLMLANTYNVELSLTKPGELVKDCLDLKLLSRVRHHEEMDENLKATTHESTQRH